jgi:hypothetical protein
LVARENDGLEGECINDEGVVTQRKERAG